VGVLHGTVWNLAGLLIPLLVALATIPPTISGLGLDRFGALTLAWMVLGYFSLFDLGVGRALTQRVAAGEAAGRQGELPALVGTALGLTAALGAAGALALGLPAGWIVERVLRVPPALVEEARGALRLLALVLPFVLATAALRGVLEARQRFDLVNAVRLPLGAFTYAAPLLVLPFSRRLDVVVGVLAAGRVAALAAHAVLCRRAAPVLAGGLRFDRALAAPLMALGGWMTVSNVVGPLMVYFDRFAVGALLGLAAVAYYATPFELVTKLLLVPMALAQVLFPAFAGRLLDDPAGAARLQDRGARALLLVLLPPVLVIAVWAPQILRLWLGEDFAQHGTAVLRWLALGVLLNGIAQVPFALLQGAGRVKTTALLHLVELPFYLAGLLFLLRAYGVTGAAIAWAARAAVDLLALAVLARRLVSAAGGRP
jgi:O-antigen/teichoic acid export membrane protein